MEKPRSEMASNQSATLSIFVKPRSGSNRVRGRREGDIIVQVTAAPVDGAANQAVIETLSRALKISRGQLSIVRGSSSRRKTVAIAGMTVTEARQRLGVE